MFKAIEVLQPNFIQRPLNELWQLISPLYNMDEEKWLNELLPWQNPLKVS